MDLSDPRASKPNVGGSIPSRRAPSPLRRAGRSLYLAALAAGLTKQGARVRVIRALAGRRGGGR